MLSQVDLQPIDWWQTAGWTMIHFLWLGAALAAASAVLRLLTRRAGPNSRYASALGSLILLSALPVAVAAWLVCERPAARDIAGGDRGAREPALRDAPEESTTIVLPSVIDLTDSAPTSDQIIELSDRPPTEWSSAMEITSGATAGGHSRALAPPTGSPASTTDDPAAFASSALVATGGSASGTQFTEILHTFAQFMPWLWVIGTPLTFALLASGFVGSRRLQQVSHAIASGPVAEACARLARSLRVSRHVTVALCERVAAPVLVGILRPMILLPPAALSGWSPDEIEMVLLHELAHVRRWDNLVNLFQRLVESLYFFHPAVWLLSTWVRREREACCDAIVVAETHEPRAYAEMLLSLAARLPRSALFPPAAASAMAAGPLRSRIRHILQLEDDPMLVSGKSLLFASLFLLVLVPATVMVWPEGGNAQSPSGVDAQSDQEQPSAGSNPFEAVKGSTSDPGQGQRYSAANPMELAPSQAVESVDPPPQADERSVLIQDHVDPTLLAQSRPGVQSTVANAQDSATTNELDPNEVIFVSYDIPAELSEAVQAWYQDAARTEGANGRWGDGGELLLQASRATHERLRGNLAKTADWRKSLESMPASTTLTSLQSPEGPRIRWWSTGLVLAPQAPVTTRTGDGGRFGPPGIEVIEVAPGSPAAWLNIRTGDLLNELEGFRIRTLEEFQSAIDNLTKTFSELGTVRVQFRESRRGGMKNVEFPLQVSAARDRQSALAQRRASRGRFTVGQPAPSTSRSRGSRGTDADVPLSMGGARQASTMRGSMSLNGASTDAVRDETAATTTSAEPQSQTPREDPAGIAEWEKLIAQTPRVEAEAAKLAWEKLGLKLAPASNDDRKRLGLQTSADSNAINLPQMMKIVGGNVPAGLPLPVFIDGFPEAREVGSLEELYLHSVKPNFPSELRVFAFDFDRNRYVFVTSPPQKPENMSANGPLPQSLNQPATIPRIDPTNAPKYAPPIAQGPLPTGPPPIAPIGSNGMYSAPTTTPYPSIDASIGSTLPPTGDNRTALRYEGKSFNEWRNAWQTELSPEKRLEAVKALAAFGANGYGKEATAAILEVVKLYTWDLVIRRNQEPTSIDLLRGEAVGAFAGKTDGSPSIAWQDWLPILTQEVKAGNERVARFARTVFGKLNPAANNSNELIGQLIPLSGDESLGATRLNVVGLLARIYENSDTRDSGPIAERLTALLNDKDETARNQAFNALYGQFRSAMSQAEQLERLRQRNSGGSTALSIGVGPVDAVIPSAKYRPELVALLDKSPEWRGSVIPVLGYLGAKAAPAVPKLLDVTLDENLDIALAAALAVGKITGSDEKVTEHLNRVISTGEPAEQVERARALLELLQQYREQGTSALLRAGFGGRGGGGGRGGRNPTARGGRG